ncbi:Retrovirus-related Pol polyprotein from transposon TNT 1-94 [Hibiscus syriacus]|uniref:Retrovirus-related Pol polyprotein from transposon TNT 1-94 n=1 Tax=Hibiscus syriacus TaxID=106335 RepID=A0A6A3C7U1_HIBSY|nr:Retrovirus-related Pol polyprotein from transposon TNT 1-94 [Hibiscus syriacus]
MKKGNYVLVTGGARYIGSHAALRLLKENYQVTIVENLSRGNMGAVKVLQELFPEPGRLQFIYADLGDAKAVDKIFSENAFDAVMHFAAVAYVGESTMDPLRYYHNITSNTLTVLKSMAAYRVPTLIYSSTCSNQSYGKAKKMAEDMILDFSKNSNMAIMILRYFNVIGSDPEGRDPEGRLGEAPRPELRDQGRISGACFDAARASWYHYQYQGKLFVKGTDYKTHDGTCIRDYIDVTDLVDVHVKALQHAQPRNVGIYNVGTWKGRSVKEFVEALKFGRRYEFVDGGVLIHGGSQKLSETIQTKPDSSGSDGCRRREGKQPEGMKNEDWAILDRQALGVIRLTLSRNVAFNIAKEKTTAGLMVALSSMYEKPSASNKVHLMRRLFNLRMVEGASVAQHLNELNTITTQLSSVEIEFNDEVRALILLSSLPDSWNATVTAVSSSSGNNKLKFDDVRDLVLSEEIRRRESGEASTSSALHTESRGRTSERNSNRGRSKSRRGKSRTGNKDFTCYNCGKKGHFKRDCRAPKKNTGAQESTNMTEETSDAIILSVHLADDETLKIVGKGDIRLKLPNQTTWKLTGVRHIPGLKRNLISVGQLDGEGYSTTFSGCEWKITKGALVIARGKKTGTLYAWSYEREMDEDPFVKRKLPDLKNVDGGLCEDCIFGKQKKVIFTKIGKTPKAERLELVHTDVWGPAPVPSLAGSLFYVTFIDDSTRKAWVYFLMKKSEVFDTFRKWKAMVENETGLKVKRLRSDNGGEYRDSRFRDFYANNGIKMETTVPITPQQNGVAERMNKTLNERARSMRIHAGLPKFLWAEAINTAAYLINRGPSVPLDGRIPEEAWSKKEINLLHLRVFGCISYVHIDSAERSKLDAKSNKCVFVGYGGDEFGYRFWDYENRKIIRSRDIIFNENVMYKDRSILKQFKKNHTHQELRRSSRIPKPTQRYSPSLHYLLLTDNGEPECYDEAMQVEDSVKWESSMKDEMDSLMSNQTWELTELPPGKKALHNKWIYRIKEEHDGSKRYKARLVVKGFQQKEGIDYNEIFSPVVKLSTIILVLKIVAAENLHLEQLKKSLYGLKQAPRQWYKKFDSFMGSSGFTRCQADHCYYIKRFDNSFIILLLYVDDMLVAGSNMQEIINLKQKLSKQFAMKDLGAAKQILGMRIKRDTKSGTLMLSQAEYINKVLSRFNMQDAKPVSTPLGVHFRLSKEQSPKTEEERAHMVKVPYASAIRSMMYAMVCTIPDIAQAVGAVSRYMNNPGKVHWEAVKWILRYLRGTTNKALCFKGRDTILTDYVDADLAGNVDIRRSTTGYVYTLGGTAMSWVSQLQKIVALSTTEAEYVAVTEANKEMVWLQSFLEELGKKQENNILYCDSQSVIHLAKNPSFHSRTKHIQLRYHFIRSLLEDGILKLEKISEAQNPADMLTKTVTTDKLKLCSTSVGMLG